MADDEKTPQRDENAETTEDQAPEAAGPVADEGPSSSQAAGEDPSSTPPAEEAPETDEQPSEDPVAEEVTAPEADQPAPVAEKPAAEETDEAPPEPESEAPKQPEAEQKKKDVIPGADLEPILVEPERPELSAEERARLEAEEEEKARREAELTADEETDAAAASRAPAKMDKGARFLATGKRKSSIARVTLLPGDGKIVVNRRSLEEFFPRPLHQTMVKQPLAVSGYEGNVDVRVRVHGGGISGQAGAVRHGVARALTEIDSELRGDLKRRGFLTRDARVKERRKAGLKKARKRPQFSKR